MKASIVNLAVGAALLPSVAAWGSLGHITVAYVASALVQEPTQTYLQALLRNETEHYLAGVATWADTIRYTKWGRFTKNFHFIDAKDDPSSYCGVDFDRDCKADGCVVASIQNYTSQLLDTSLPPWRRNQAAKFVIHFLGDIHQPLHTENVAMGGNGIHVRFDGVELNLHHVWDTSIAAKFLGGVHRVPYHDASLWADSLVKDIRTGKFAAARDEWLAGLDVEDPIGSSMIWANQSNAYVCSHVLPEGPAAIVGKELGGAYFDEAGPVIEVSVARAGVRLAAWLDSIVAKLLLTPGAEEGMLSVASQSWGEEYDDVEAQVAQLEARPSSIEASSAQVVMEL
ncbi:putative nuclease S1 precursor [Microdochium trichocladiopsis]|uniref:Nuclease S1 n=1 Tax=Microdochium trichocladiopsis TaxID=1682393 RepID=A0A9P8YG32_9PEZI|nr:putative nuclease S1 precursor [Microdochium trichocladiopsis]KAH7037410.1 putative nuclease S1 precursor [Microdochium trichocladiopsis]